MDTVENLEHDKFENSVFRLSRVVSLHSHGCGSLACPVCRKRRASVLRDMVSTAIEHGFGRDGLYMVTFTFRHDLTALDSYLASSRERSMSECMRILRRFGAGEWFSMSEFQGNGYLHFHCLVEFPTMLDFHKVKSDGKLLYSDSAIGELMRSLRCAWHWGAVNFLWVQSVGSASSYVTKYLCGGGEKHPVPDWVLSLPRFRFFSTSRGFWAKFGVNSKKSSPKKTDGKVSLEVEKTTLGDRVKKCGSKVDLFFHTKFLGTVCASLVSLSCMIPHRISSVYSDNGYGVCRVRECVSFDTASLLLSCNDDGLFNWKKELDRNDDAIRWLDSCEAEFSFGSFGRDYFNRDRNFQYPFVEVS